jgi:hypothetical protein
VSILLYANLRGCVVRSWVLYEIRIRVSNEIRIRMSNEIRILMMTTMMTRLTRSVRVRRRVTSGNLRVLNVVSNY